MLRNIFPTESNRSVTKQIVFIARNMTEIVQNEVTYHAAEQCDDQRLSDLCRSEGWNASPKDVKYLRSFQPSAANVARCGGTTIGRFSI